MPLAYFSKVHTSLKLDVVSYPKDQPLGYLELAALVVNNLPRGEQFILLGESFSGPVAIALAASRPAGLIGLVLSCSFARNPVPRFKLFRSMIGFIPLTRKLTGLIAPLLFGRLSSPRLRSELMNALDGVSANALRARLRAVLDVDFSDKLNQISVPILYLQALEDRVVPASAGRHIQSVVPTANIVRMRGPHLLLQTLPDEAASIIQNFIGTSCAVFNTTGKHDA